MNPFKPSLVGLGIREGTTNFFGDALRAITLEWWYH